jgi:hypothetical protein
MSLFIEDGKGTGSKMGVNTDNQGLVQAEIHELNHYVSVNRGQVYQTLGEITTIAAATETVLHMRNDSSSKLFVVSFIRLQIAGEANGTALSAVQTYFELGFGRTYASGGVAQVPVNMNQTSGNVAALTAYDESPVLAGTFVQFDKWYAATDAMLVYSKQGSVILGLNDTLEIRLVTDHTAGNALVRVTGMFVDQSNNA